MWHLSALLLSLKYLQTSYFKTTCLKGWDAVIKERYRPFFLGYHENVGLKTDTSITFACKQSAYYHKQSCYYVDVNEIWVFNFKCLRISPTFHPVLFVVLLPVDTLYLVGCPCPVSLQKHRRQILWCREDFIHHFFCIMAISINNRQLAAMNCLNTVEVAATCRFSIA